MKTIRCILAIITVLLLGLLIASAQTAVAVTNIMSPDSSGLPTVWHGFTLTHGALALTIVGWLTHANWPTILAAYEWLGLQGGIFGILRKIAIGKKSCSILLILSIGVLTGCNTTHFEATRSDGTKITVINRRFFWATEGYSCQIGTNSASLTASKSTVDSAAISAAAAGAAEGAARFLSK